MPPARFAEINILLTSFINPIRQMVQKMPLIALGANISSQSNSLRSEIESIFVHLTPFLPTFSPIYLTPAFPTGSGPDFLNAAIQIETDVSPEKLLDRLHRIEDLFSRTRPYRWAPRSCDLDLLFYDDLVRPSHEVFHNFAQFSTSEAIANTPTELILPHPRLHERAFVLGPLRDIAPNFIHPVFQKTIAELWEELPKQERDEISKLD